MPSRTPELTQIPFDLVCLTDYEAYARERLDDNAWAYLHSGAADELTMARNREAFARLQLWPRLLRDLARGHTRLELFGQTLDHPLLLAPVAHQGLYHPAGELASAQGAAALGAPLVVSTLASQPLEAVAQAGEGPLWFQLYFQPDRDFTLSLVRRAEAAGYQALVVTVDAPIFGLRNREQRAGFHLPPGLEAANLRSMPPFQPAPLGPEARMVFQGLMAYAPTWTDIAWLRSQTALPLLLKGVLHPGDALQGEALGVDGIIVSNHGGRAQDTVPPSIQALPRIATALEGRLPLLLDGGIRRGSDVFKALALGARAVLIGRPYIYGLATAGALGVAHCLKLLREELEVVMALNGCATLADITPDSLFPDPAPPGHLQPFQV